MGMCVYVGACLSSVVVGCVLWCIHTIVCAVAVHTCQYLQLCVVHCRFHAQTHGERGDMCGRRRRGACVLLGAGGGVTSSVTTRFVKTLWGWPWVHGVGVGCALWCLHSSDPSQLTSMSPQPSHHGFVYHNRQYASAMPFLPALWKPLPIVEDAAAPTR